MCHWFRTTDGHEAKQEDRSGGRRPVAWFPLRKALKPHAPILLDFFVFVKALVDVIPHVCGDLDSRSLPAQFIPN
jgi:hypothetical protein